MRKSIARVLHAASTLISRSRIIPVLFLCLLVVLLVAGQAIADRGYGGHGYYRGGGHYGGHYSGHRYYGGHGYYRGPSVGFGLYYGGPYWGAGWGYPYPYYSPYYPMYSPYYDTGVTIETTPPVYIERSQTPAPAENPPIWFYCPESKKYYPYVKECPGGWQSVPAQPPAPER